jgi:hypothetical protein
MQPYKTKFVDGKQYSDSLTTNTPTGALSSKQLSTVYSKYNYTNEENVLILEDMDGDHYHLPYSYDNVTDEEFKESGDYLQYTPSDIAKFIMRHNGAIILKNANGKFVITDTGKLSFTKNSNELLSTISDTLHKINDALLNLVSTQSLPLGGPLTGSAALSVIQGEFATLITQFDQFKV